MQTNPQITRYLANLLLMWENNGDTSAIELGNEREIYRIAYFTIGSFKGRGNQYILVG